VSNKRAPTKKQRDERARRAAMGIAVIQRPLKFIEARHVAGSSMYKAARLEAKNGQGHMVKQLALHSLNGGV